MNKTLTSLRIASYFQSSPIINMQAGSSVSFFKMSNSYFAHSFKSAIFSSNPVKNTIIQTSKFRKFLQSAININSYELSEQTRNRHSDFDHDVCIIRRCFFLDCETKGDGGAIKYLRDIGEFHAIETMFNSASASDNGGAFYLQPKFFRLSRCCIDQCKAGNAGQSFLVCPIDDFPDDINYTTFSQCSPMLFGSIQYNLHHNGGGGQYYNSNISRGLCTRGGAALACFRTNNAIIAYTHFIHCKGGSIIALEFGREPSRFELCNIINNTHTQAQILVFSQATTLYKCIMLRNTKPFSRPIMTGRKHSLDLQDCIYDAIGLEQKAGILINNPIPYVEHTTIPFQVEKMLFCQERKAERVNPFEGFSFIYFFIVIIGILFVHLSFIHPQIVSDVYLAMFFDTNKESRRRRAHATVA